MCIYGFNTDSDIPGVEKLVVNEPNELLLDKPYSANHMVAGLVPCGGVAYTKGWTRSIVALFLMDCILKLEMVESIKVNGARFKVWDKFRTIHVVVGDYTNESERVLGNRGGLRALYLHPNTLTGSYPGFLHPLSTRMQYISTSQASQWLLHRHDGGQMRSTFCTNCGSWSVSLLPASPP